MPPTPQCLFKVSTVHSSVEFDKIKTYKLRPYEVKSMSISEQKILSILIKKHGDDYAKMAMDIKINVHQKTPKQLKTRVRLYKKIQGMAE